jgi:hypothetical protein
MDELRLASHALRAPRGAVGLSLVVLLAGGCSGGDQANVDSPSELAARVGCSDSYEAVTTDALGVQGVGKCTFRGYELSLVTFADNGARNNYICSTCGFDAETDAGVTENAARALGSRLVVGDRYLVEAPGAAAERAVRGALAG